MQMVVRWPWRMLCRCDCVVWWMLCHLRLLRVWQMLCCFFSTLADVLPSWSCYSVDAWPPSRASCSLSLGIFGDSTLCWSCGWICLECPPPQCFFLLSTCCVSGYSCFMCLSVFFLQCFFLSPLCSCVGQVLFGRNKFVSVTAFFLMKNVLRHGREKN